MFVLLSCRLKINFLIFVLGLMQLSHAINTVLLVFWSVHQLWWVGDQVNRSYRLQLG